MPGVSTERFSSRVADYVRYRPDYPEAVIDYLRQHAGLSASSIVADIGSGTGIFTRHLLEAGCKVFAVEPNEAMRQAGENMLGSLPGFVSVCAKANDTGLQNDSVDIIVCAQAFHWFNNDETKAEFQRILKTGCYVALIWNNRLVNADAFSIAYEALLQQNGTDYREVNHQNLKADDFRAFYRNGEYERVCFPNEQIFDEAGLIGRAFSSSYVPPADTDAGHELLKGLKNVFRKYQENGTVCVKYETELYVGRLGARLPSD
jgi:SAM-dependent methyltransferase